jgi:hypothetical protein
MAGGYLWLLGAASSVVGSVCSNFGVNIQKYAFMKNQDKPQSQQVPYYKMGGWVLGLALVILGSLGDFVALGLAAQSIVASSAAPAWRWPSATTRSRRSR